MRFTGIALLAAAFAVAVSAAPAKNAEKKEISTAGKTAVKKNKSKQRVNKKRTPPPASVNISTFSVNAKDATAAMLAAIKSRSREIVFDKPGVYKLRPVQLPRPVRIILNDGVTIQGLPQLLPGKGKKIAGLPGLFTVNRLKQVYFTGRGNAVIKGDKLPVFHLSNSNNLSINNITVNGGKRAVLAQNCWNFRIQDAVFDSLTDTAVEFRTGGWNNIYNTQFRNLPGSALTVIANTSGKIPNMTLDNCEFFNNGASVKLAAPEKFIIKPVDIKKNPKYRPPRLTFRSCRFFNNSGNDLELFGALADGLIRVENNVFTNAANPALVLRDFSKGNGLKAEIVSTEFRPEISNPMPPVLVSTSQSAPFGNINFIKSKVKQPVNKKAVEFDVKKAEGNIAGKLLIIAADGSVRNAVLTMEGK